MGYYLGIDGGGTKTAFTIIDDNNNIIYQNTIGPSSVDTVAIELTKESFLKEFNNHVYPINSIFAGIGGITCSEDINKINEILRLHPGLINKEAIDSNNDVVNALYGALDGADGIIIIAGTGSAAFGKYNNKLKRSGGYCYQEGDAGSSYYLGYKGLQYLARVIDGRLPGGRLADALMKESNCYDYPSLASFFINESRTKIASLAPVITKNSNDSFARKIIDKATDEMLLMIKAVYNGLGFANGTSLAIIGSLGNADTLYKQMLIEKLNAFNSNIALCEAKYNPSIGSALKAKEIKK